MSTNFLPFNLGKNNQENDATYLADAQRVGGALTGSIFASPLANKAFYQWSIFVSAFTTMMANKGYTVSDADFAALVAVLTNIKTSADFEASLVIVNYATSITFNAATSAGFDLTLTGNVSVSALSNTSVGQIITFIVRQDSTGNRIFPWPTNLTNPQQICPAPNSVSIQQFVVTTTGILPLTGQIWNTASGVVMQPAGFVGIISSSGNIPNNYANYAEEVNAASTPISRTLFTAVGYRGFEVNVKKMDTSPNAVTVLTTDGQTIDGLFLNYGITKPFTSLTFLSDGANWIIV
jgi:hypothetical protein